MPSVDPRSVSSSLGDSPFHVRPVSVSALGVVSWDEVYLLETYPAEGFFGLVTDHLSAPGGTTGNAAMVALKLGSSVHVFSKVGVDERGAALVQSLASAGADVSGILTAPEATDLSVVLVTGETSERTILWQKGPYLKRGDRIDIESLFGADVVILDPVDYELRRFLTDLPAHTRPSTRILGPLTYLEDVVADDKTEVALRHDVVVGNEREYCLLTGEHDPDVALEVLRGRLPGSNCRLAIMTRGASGSMAVSAAERWDCPAFPVEPVDTTGAGDAFAGAIAFGLAQRWSVPAMLSFASVVAALVVGSLGAQAGQPDLPTVLGRLAQP